MGADYELGRSLQQMKAPFQGADATVAAQRLDETAIENARYEHCTFINVSFKKARLSGCVFTNCVFFDCYWRRAQLQSSQFVGCKFIDCDFSRISVSACDFKYAVFRGCQIPLDELEHSLPREPNLRERLARNLSIESSRLGLVQDSRRYRMKEIEAREDNLKAAILGGSKWYRDHYDLPARGRAAVELMLSRLNGWLWGYGERSAVLIRNYLLFALVIFPLLFYWNRDGLLATDGSEIRVSALIYFSLANVIPAGINSNIIANSDIVRGLVAAESVVGVLSIALFASYVFRWSLHR